MRYAFRMEEAIDPKNIVGSIIKGARLLDSFSAERREVTLSEFAAETGYNKTTTYRLLQTLVTAGWLTRAPSGGYRLGVKLLYLGAIARADVDLRREGLPLMRELAEEFGDTAFLMLPEQEGAVVIETIVGRNPVRVHGVTVGTVLPYHVAAGPVVLAAFNPEVEARVLKMPRTQLTTQTITGKHDLRERYQKTRERGYATSFEDYVDEVSAVAAPVMGPDGVAIGSLSLGGPTSRFQDADLLKAMIRRLRETARELTTRMGS